MNIFFEKLGKKELIGGIVVGLIFFAFILLFFHFQNKDVYYQVIFDSMGGSDVAGQNVLVGDVVRTPNETVREGYQFDGWYWHDKKFDFNTKIRQDITLKAKWIMNTKDQDTLVDEDKKEEVAEEKKEEEKKDTSTTNSSEQNSSSRQNNTPTPQPSPSEQVTPTPQPAPQPEPEVPAVTYSAIMVDAPGSAINQCYIYIKSSNGEYVSGVVSVTYLGGATGTLSIPTSGYLTARGVIQSISVLSVN